MANHPSSEKRHRQTVVRTARNRSIRTSYRSLVKAVRSAIESGNQTTAATALKHATKAIDSAVSQGVLHRSSASRKVSRLTLAVNTMNSAAA